MLTIAALNAYGANTAEGLGRCLGREDFYFRLIGMAVKDPGFEKLSAALAAGDAKAAFDAAHALKGILGNLALTPLYTPVSQLTELVRREELEGTAALLTEIESKHQELKALAED